MTLQEACHKLYEELGGIEAQKTTKFAVGEGANQIIVYGKGKRPTNLPEQYEGFPHKTIIYKSGGLRDRK